MDIVELIDADESFGGKAFGLKKLQLAGCNVPHGIAINNEFIKKIIDNDRGCREALEEKLTSFTKGVKVAIRSSASAEDGEKKSYAGMFETILNVNPTKDDIINAIEKVYQSSFSERVKAYDNEEIQNMNIVIQEMVSPQIAGVAFTSAVDTDGKDICLIEMVKGLADKLVSGETKSSTVKVEKVNGEMAYDRVEFSGMPMNIEHVPNLLNEIEKAVHYFGRPMDIEWCIAEVGKPYLVQARPITKIPLVRESEENNAILASPGVAMGMTFVIDEIDDDEAINQRIKDFPDGAILIASSTETNYLPAMKKASGIITEEGSALSHAAIVAREIGIPCIAGFSGAKEKFPSGMVIKMDATKGEISSEKIVENISKRDSFDFDELYCFDNLMPITINDKKILVEHNLKGVVVFTPDDIQGDDIDQIEMFVRTNYKQVPRFSSSYKYLWYFELERFKKLPLFNEMVQKSKELVAMKDSNKLEAFYRQTLEKVKKLAEYKERKEVDPFEKVLLEETCMAYHFVLDALLPNGYAELQVYKDTYPLLYTEGKSFNDFLNRDFDTSDSKLVTNFEFLKTVAKNRNEICQKFIDVGAMSLDYFDTRESRMQDGLRSKNITLQKGIEDAFYENISEANQKKIKKMLTVFS